MGSPAKTVRPVELERVRPEGGRTGVEIVGDLDQDAGRLAAVARGERTRARRPDLQAPARALRRGGAIVGCVAPHATFYAIRAAGIPATLDPRVGSRSRTDMGSRSRRGRRQGSVWRQGFWALGV